MSAAGGFEDFSCGQIRLKFEYRPGHKKGNVSCTVVECQSLLAKDKNGLSDPYVILTAGKTKYKTKVVKKDLNPTFNQTFVLYVIFSLCCLLFLYFIFHIFYFFLIFSFFSFFFFLFFLFL